MSQHSIPFLLMRGGSSRGAYFKRADLPQDEGELSAMLIDIMGAGHPLNIDGIGGGASVSTKVAMLSRSEGGATDNTDKTDIDYFFAQVAVEERVVDYAPTCGNILVGVAPTAIEMGLFEASEGETTLSIRALNTGARIRAVVQTPDRKVRYDGSCAIDGVPGTAAPISLEFTDIVGSKTKGLLPTGFAQEMIGGIPVTCMDVAVPMVIARAESFGLTGQESSEALDEKKDFLARMQAVRREGGARMGLGEVKDSVVPKFALISRATRGGDISARYFVPWKCHPTMAATGAQCLAACLLTRGTVAENLRQKDYGEGVVSVSIEHPSGVFGLEVDFSCEGEHGFLLRSTRLTRTARKIVSGYVFC